MTAALWIELFVGILKFPKELLALIQVLKKTPSEKYQDIVAAAQKESDTFKDTGRPTW